MQLCKFLKNHKEFKIGQENKHEYYELLLF
jgi:hypothetical protein